MLALLAISGLFWELGKNPMLHYEVQQLPLLPHQLSLRHICLGSPLGALFVFEPGSKSETGLG